MDKNRKFDNIPFTRKLLNFSLGGGRKEQDG